MKPAITAGQSDRSLVRKFLPLLVVALIVALAVPAIAKHRPVGEDIAAVGFNGATFDFEPNDITIVEGTNVAFFNLSPNAPHTVTSFDFLFESGAVQPGQSRVVNTERLAAGETYDFFCGFHPDIMFGSITVVSG